MKVLQVNNVYGEKSTGKITKVIHDGLLRHGFESVVVYGRGRDTTDPGVIRLCPDWYGKMNSLLSRITGMPYGGCLLSTWRLMGIIRREKPDVVHLQCINGNFVNIYRLIAWLKSHGIPTVVTLHAEFMYTANCGHAFDCDQWKHGCRRCPNRKKAVKSWFFDRTGCSWNAMRKAFTGFEDRCVIAPVSPWTENRARQSDILKDFSFQTVYNGVDAEHTFTLPENSPVQDRAVLNVTAHFSGEECHAKGGWYLIQLAKRMPDVEFLVAGRADEIPDLPANIRVLGVVADQQMLAQLYRGAKVSVLVSQKETFSMPCAESLCCGTPVVGFKAGGPEQIGLKEYSKFVDFGDLDSLEKQIRQELERSDRDRVAIAAEAKAAYGAHTMIRNYEDIYRRML